MSECTHKDRIDMDPIAQDARGGLVCQACVDMGSSWVHLRQCRTCGIVGCCDSSPNRHARAHAGRAGHPLVEPVSEGEGSWVYCYEDDAELLAERPAGPAAATPR